MSKRWYFVTHSTIINKTLTFVELVVIGLFSYLKRGEVLMSGLLESLWFVVCGWIVFANLFR